MSIIEKIRDFLNGNERRDKEQKLLVDQIAKQAEKEMKNAETLEEGINQVAVQTIEKVGREDPRVAKDAVKKLLKEFKENKEMTKEGMDQFAEQILKAALESSKIPASKTVEVAEVLPDRTIAKVLENSATVGQGERLVGVIEDKDIKRKSEENILVQKLRELYEKVEDLEDQKLLDKLGKIKEKAQTDFAKNKMKQVVAKKVASDCVKHNGPKLWSMMKIIPAQEMLDSYFAEEVEKEAFKLEKEHEETGVKIKYPFNSTQKRDINEQITDNIAKNIAAVYRDSGIINIPQSEVIKKFTEEEKEKFNGKIKKACENIGEKVSQEMMEKNQVYEMLNQVNERIRDLPNDKAKKIIEFLN